MIVPYVVRLICICSAAFFLIHAAAAATVSLLGACAIRLAGRMRARNAARFLLAVRLLPAVLAWIIVAALCVPSYLWLEPAGTSEAVGLRCLVAALSAVACWILSGFRSWRAVSRSFGYIRYCRLMGRRTCLGAESAPAWVVECGQPFLVLAGVVRPKLMISREVVAGLPAEQLAAALRHEHAHRISHDNLKRLLVLLAPDILPFWRGFGALDHAWARFTEWAADDRAVGGDSERSLSLAAALVSVARMGACPQTPPLVTNLLADNDDLAQRVDRLLREAPAAAEDRRRPMLAIAGTAATFSLLAVLAQPATLYAVHDLLERLTHP